MTENMKQYDSHGIMTYFEAISNIPRKSGHEMAVSNYIKQFAEDLGLTVHQDEHYNLIINKPGTAGYEDHDPVILQGHTDMVCTKIDGVEHDFLKDGIELITDGDILKANGTTLGADDGFSVAYGMALLASKDIPHPPLEVVFTVEEETSFKGIKTVDASRLKGRKLFNLDGDREGEVTIGSAGGHGYHVELPITRKPIHNDMTLRRLSISNLIGGHSGGDIHLGRANGIYILAQVVKRMINEHRLSIVSLKGGSAPNAIPLAASVDFYVHLTDLPYLMVLGKEEAAKWNEVHKAAGEQMEITVAAPDRSDIGKLVDLDLDAVTLDRAISKDDLEKWIAIVENTPQGVLGKNDAGEVIYSNNIGLLATTDSAITMELQARSTEPARLDEHAAALEKVVTKEGGTVAVNSPYPSWTPVEKSPLQALVAETYKDLTGKDATFVVTHGGLEVGYLAEALGEIDAVNMGPNIYDLHAPTERMEIPSFVRTFELLVAVLGKC